MKRICTIVCYDIADDKRRQRVYDTCRAYGQHTQYSVFRCDLTPIARASLIAELDKVIHHREDQILLVVVGPTDGRAKDAFATLGKTYKPPEFGIAIV